MAYVTAAVVKSDWLNITDTTHDALIARLITAVLAEIDGICMQPIEAVAVTRYFDGNSSYRSHLPYTVPVTLGVVSKRGTPLESWVTVDATTLVLDTADGISQIYNSSAFTENGYKAALTVGYTTAAVPAEIATCAYEMIKELFNETPFAAGGDRFGVSAITQGDAGMTFSKAILAMRPRVTERLRPYMMLTV